MSVEIERCGHRVVDHTADEIVTAWGPTREACLEQAALGLIDSVADVRDVGWCHHVEVVLRGTDTELLVGLLDEIIFRLDADDEIPVRVRIRRHGREVVAGLWMADRRAAVMAGAAPKGVSYSGLMIEEDPSGLWRCQVTVDV